MLALLEKLDIVLLSLHKNWWYKERLTLLIIKKINFRIKENLADIEDAIRNERRIQNLVSYLDGRLNATSLERASQLDPRLLCKS